MKKDDSKGDRLEKIVAEARRNREQREQGYRDRALKLYPWVCARCGREFDRSNVRELTVHHKDHDHDNNPPDGSNWELLCIYCHENEHSRYVEHERYGESVDPTEHGTAATYKPFDVLKNLLKGKE